MAKGNMLLGYSRGAVGDIVFARSKGQQVARARNRNPNNPNTVGQVLQRSKFAAAQRFFQLANSQFFKFAYEDKTERESDYNAFMRHNVAIAPYILREMTQRTDYPAFAPWLVTQGSLASIVTVAPTWISGVSQWMIPNPFGIELSVSDVTVAEITDALLSSSADWRIGDIYTLIQQTSVYGEYPLAVTSGSSEYVHYKSQTVVRQFVLDSSDYRQLSEVVPGLSGLEYIVMDSQGDIFNDSHGAIAIAIIHSRNTPQGLKVSTQSMMLNNDANGGTLEGALGSYDFTRSAQYETRILASWQAASKAVLAGGASTVYEPMRVVRIDQGSTQYSSLPAVINNAASTLPVNNLLKTYYSDTVQPNLSAVQAGWTFTGGVSLATSPWGEPSGTELDINFRVTSAGTALFNGVEVIRFTTT